MSLPFNITNPGFQLGGTLTTAEQEYVTNLVGLTYAQGDILYYDGSDMINLGPGTAGQLLQTGGAAANPSWVTASGTGDMVAATYDPAAIAEQLVGLTASQTLTNKSIDGDNNTITNIGFAEFDVDTADTMGFVAGAYLDDPSVDVTSNGTVITCTVEKDGGGDIRVHFITGLTTIDCTPAVTVSLTAGSDTVPTMNYIYFDEPTNTLTANTTGFPVADIARIAEVLCPSATKVQSEGPYSQRNWTDHLKSTTCGHLSHMNLWIRAQAATWISGVMTTPTITVNGGAEDNIDVSLSSGSVLQLHAHDYPAFDTAVASHIQVINDFTTPYVEITDLNAADTDDSGNAIGNNKYTNLVLWGVVSEDSVDCHLVVNLPSGFHSSADAATIDAEGYSNYTIPSDYKGTGFLIARLTLKYSTSSSGTWTLTENKDLRNGGSTGGSGTGTTEFSDNVFRILDDADTTKEIAFQASGITTATTRTITMPDADVTLGVAEGTAILSTGEVGGTKFLREDGDGTCSWVLVTAGDAWGDVVDADILPDGDDTRDLGSAALRFAEAHVTEVNSSRCISSDTWTRAIMDWYVEPSAIEIMAFNGAGASAVNYLQVDNSLTGVAPFVTAVGTDTNISINLIPKGSGEVQVAGQKIIDETDTASATAAGIVELATDAETATGTDTARATTPANIASLGYDAVASTSEASSGTPAPTGDSVRNEHYLTALAAAAAFTNPSGTAVNGNILTIRIKDNATIRALTWGTEYRGLADTLPSTTVASKTMYIGFKYNSADTKWDMVALNEEA